MLVPVLFIVVLLLLLLYLNSLYHEKYWKNKGVPFASQYKILSPIWEYLKSDRPLFQIYGDIYKKYSNEAAVGFGSLLSPTLLVRDIQNIQHIMQHDFNSFNHRGMEITRADKLADNILFMHGARWKLMRQSMSPLFTATKLKTMYGIVDKSAKDFVQYLKSNPQYWTTDAFGTLNTFCSASVGAAVFGITSNSIFDSPFLDMARDSIKPTLMFNLKFALITLSYQFSKAINVTIFSKYENFFIKAVESVMHQRKVDNTSRNDFIDQCIHLQKNDMLRDSTTGYEIKPTTDILAAQGFFFFIAGVEPSATAMYGVLIELGRHPEILQRVHDEIDATLEKNDGQLSHDVLHDMEYLDKVLSEGLRMYPPIGFLIRQCIKDSVLPVGNIKIDKGTKLFIPIFEVHYDERYYPNPEVFNPNRFSKDGLQAALSNSTYMPFGKGNRLCIGTRYARLQVKAGLVHLLRNFSVKTIVGPGGINFKKEAMQVRPWNVNVHFIPRDVKA